MEAKVWTVPAKRMKAGKEHRVPLSTAAIAVLQPMPRESAFIFSGRTHHTLLSDMSLAAAYRRGDSLDRVLLLNTSGGIRVDAHAEFDGALVQYGDQPAGGIAAVEQQQVIGGKAVEMLDQKLAPIQEPPPIARLRRMPAAARPLQMGC